VGAGHITALHPAHRLALVLALTILLAALVVAAGLTSAASAKPPGPPPPVGSLGGSPPAWAQSGKRAVWLARGSYCWGHACVDYLPPQKRTDIPTLFVSRGGVVGVHLAFRPASLLVLAISRPGSTALPHVRDTYWSPRRSGLFMFVAAAALGDAAYLVRIILS
jgi:hypothetical protein